MSNFIRLVYATLKNKGINTDKLSTEEAINKFKEIKSKDENPENIKRKLNGEKPKGDIDKYKEYRSLLFEEELENQAKDPHSKLSDYATKADKEARKINTEQQETASKKMNELWKNKNK